MGIQSQLLDVGRHPKDDSWSRGAKNKKSKMDSLPKMGDMPTMPSKYLLLPTWVFVVLSILIPPAAVFMLKDIGLHLIKYDGLVKCQRISILLLGNCARIS